MASKIDIDILNTRDRDHTLEVVSVAFWEIDCTACLTVVECLSDGNGVVRLALGNNTCLSSSHLVKAKREQQDSCNGSSQRGELNHDRI